MSNTLKEKMIENVRKGDDVIKGIKDDQMIIVSNYVKASYGLEAGSKFFMNDTKVQLHHLSFTDGGRKINLHYQRIKFNNSVESKIFTTLLSNNIKIQPLDATS